MKLELRDGKVVWVKADGNPSIREASQKAITTFHGFPELTGPEGEVCTSLWIIAGDPATDEVILVSASGQSWWEKFLISKKTGECIELREEETGLADELVKDPSSLPDAFEMLGGQGDRKRRPVPVQKPPARDSERRFEFREFYEPRARQAITKCFPQMPSEDLEDIIKQAWKADFDFSSGMSRPRGSAWFTVRPDPAAEKQAADAARQAVHVLVEEYIRQKHTDYEKRLKKARREAHSAAAGRVTEVLEKWQGGNGSEGRPQVLATSKRS